MECVFCVVCGLTMGESRASGKVVFYLAMQMALGKALLWVGEGLTRTANYEPQKLNPQWGPQLVLEAAGSS